MNGPDLHTLPGGHSPAPVNVNVGGAGGSGILGKVAAILSIISVLSTSGTYIYRTMVMGAETLVRAEGKDIVAPGGDKPKGIFVKTKEVIKEKLGAGNPIAGAMTKAEDRAEKVGEKIKETKDEALEKIRSWQESHAKAADLAQRQQLIARAAVIGFAVDDKWTTEQMLAEVTRAAAKWEEAHGPNAVCLNKRCGMPVRVETDRDWKCVCGHKSSGLSSKRKWTALHTPMPGRRR